ncbi:uncharacterized protein FA14DRAFT_110222, partial [Meira miltonrushii]
NEWAKDTQEDIQTFGIAGRIWEASYLLQRYLTFTSSDQFDPPCSDLFGGNKNTIIELGAGVGLVGIHLAQQLQQHNTQSSHVVLTDLHNVLPLLARNAAKAGVYGNNVKVEPLPWGSESDAKAILTTARDESRPVTHILCSDLVYFPELLPPLMRTLIQITAEAPNAKVIISYKIRSLPKEEPFWRTFGAWFDFSPVLIAERKADSTNDQQQSWRLFGAKKSDMYAPSHALANLKDEDAEDDVFIFVATRRPETLSCTPVSNDARLMEG